jgi:hypothetical protein
VSDPFDLLRQHLRAEAANLEPGTSTGELVAHITLEHDRSQARAPRRRRRGWLVLVAGVGAGALVGTVATASLVNHQPVTAPEAGVVCRSAAQPDSSAIVIMAPGDPVEACGHLWRTGALPDVEVVNPPSDPPLVACTGAGGALEVYPGDSAEACTAMGLGVADVRATMEDPVRELSMRVGELNLRCLDAQAATTDGRALLDELGLGGWSVAVRPGSATCYALAVATNERTLYVTPLPPRT